ncbi:hypothetical protein N136_02972, partial [Leifsonia aquatica ATCC 14665]
MDALGHTLQPFPQGALLTAHGGELLVLAGAFRFGGGEFESGLCDGTVGGGEHGRQHVDDALSGVQLATTDHRASSGLFGGGALGLQLTGQG